MKKGITKNGWILILGVLAFGLIGVELLHRHGPAARQWKNIMLAREYAAEKTKEIEGIEAYAHVAVSEFTGLNGSVLVHGFLNEKNEDELKAIIYTDELPTEVAWKVRVLDQESWDEYVSYEQSTE